VHRDDEARPQLTNDLHALLGADGRPAPDRQEEDVDLAERGELLGAQRPLAEVAEVRDGKPVQLDADEEVRAAARARDIVVLGGRRDDLAEGRVVRAGRRADDGRIPECKLGAVVIRMLVRDEQQVDLERLDRWVFEPDAALRQGRDAVTERVDEYAPGCRFQQEGGLAEPGDVHHASVRGCRVEVHADGGARLAMCIMQEMQAVDEVGARRPSMRAWWVWGVAVSFYLVAVFHRMALGVAGLAAEHHLHVDHAALANFTALQYFVYLTMQLPAGLAADRIGPRRTLAAGLACMALGELVFALAHGLGLGLVGRGLVGMGDALTLLNVLRLTHSWFPPRMGSLLAALTGAVGAVGQLMGTVPLEWALHHVGWTATFAGSSALTVLLLGAAFAVIRDRPPGAAAPAPAEHQPVLATLRATWRRPGTRHGFWVHLALFCPFHTIGALWGVPFLVEGQHLGTATAATYLLVLTATFAATGPVIGALAGRGLRAQNRVVLALNAMIVAVWSVILLWPGGEIPRPVLLAGFVACGLAASGGMVAFDIGRRENPPLAAGSATALVNCGGFLAGVVCLEVVGMALGGGTPGATRWQVALLPMLVLSAAGMVQSVRLSRRREQAPAAVAMAAAD
jgi:sugar phosphate permease